MYRCIAMHSILMHVLIQQNEYRFIDILMYPYHCVLINEWFSAMYKIEPQKIVVR